MAINNLRCAVLGLLIDYDDVCVSDDARAEDRELVRTCDACLTLRYTIRRNLYRRLSTNVLPTRSVYATSALAYRLGAALAAGRLTGLLLNVMLDFVRVERSCAIAGRVRMDMGLDEEAVRFVLYLAMDGRCFYVTRSSELANNIPSIEVLIREYRMLAPYRADL